MDNITNLEELKTIYTAIDEKQGEDIKVIDVRGLTSLTDFFIITNGKNPKQIDAICDSVKNELAKVDITTENVEGYGSNWALLDYDFAFVHVFSKEARENYELERLWSDGNFLDVELFK